MSQGDQDKTEQPTPFRLDEARKRGEVAKSVDVAGAMSMIVFASIIGLTAASIAIAFAVATSRMISVAGDVAALNGAFVTWVLQVYAPLWQALAPVVLGLLVVAVVGHVVQTGPILSAHPLKPDFKRMNPAQNIKRIFSMRTLWELGKLTLKFLLLAGVCALFVSKAAILAEAVAMTIPQRAGMMLHAAFVKTSIYVLLVLAVVAAADLLFSRREFTKKMKMSRRELKDEIKRRDGDPAVKSKQKQQLRELLKKTRAIARVPSADVVLTNPTHVAVALRYRPGETPAPVVLAKGAGVLGGRIRSIAARHRVPIVRSPKLARALYRECDIDGMVPTDMYLSLAPIYRELWATKRAGAA
jgi:flagellar biosynthesis protein FlhB